MTSPWSDGIASDLEPAADDARHSDSVDPSDEKPAVFIRDIYGLYAACDCADCRAIVALVEEPIDKP